MDSLSKAKYLLETNQHMTISTADAAGKPWISPVFFMYDTDFNLYWVSNPEALHSRNIRNRPQTAVVVFGELPDGRFDGVYFDTVASELTDEANIRRAIEIYTRRPQPSRFTVTSPADVTGSSSQRIYSAKPVAISKCVVTTKHGQTITIREPLDL